MKLFTVTALVRMRDGKDWPLGVAWVRANNQRDATMWALTQGNVSLPSKARGMRVDSTDWFDRLFIWFNLLPVTDIAGGEQ